MAGTVQIPGKVCREAEGLQKQTTSPPTTTLTCHLHHSADTIRPNAPTMPSIRVLNPSSAFPSARNASGSVQQARRPGQTLSSQGFVAQAHLAPGGVGEDGGEGAAVEGADVVVHVPVVGHGHGVGAGVELRVEVGFVGGQVVVSRHGAGRAQGDDDAGVAVQGLSRAARASLGPSV